MTEEKAFFHRRKSVLFELAGVVAVSAVSTEFIEMNFAE
jgi:hypothetical protein